MMTRKELNNYLESFGTKMSERAISRELHGNGIKSSTTRKTPMLTKKLVASHLNFTKHHVEKVYGYLKNVIWFHETKI